MTVNRSQDFYDLCLFAYLRGFQEIPEELLKKYNIVRNYYAFLEKRKSIDIHAVIASNYSFSHEVVFEYFACKSVEQMSREKAKPFLLSLFARTRYNNIQKMLSQVIARKFPDNIEYFEDLVKVIITLQSRFIGTIPEDYLNRINKLSIEMLASNQVSIAALKDADIIWMLISHNFQFLAHDKNALFAELLSTGVINHIVGCLQVCTPPQQERIIQSTLHQLLPSKSNDNNT